LVEVVLALSHVMLSLEYLVLIIGVKGNEKKGILINERDILNLYHVILMNIISVLVMLLNINLNGTLTH